MPPIPADVIAVHIDLSGRGGDRRPLHDTASVEFWTEDHYCLGKIPGKLAREILCAYLVRLRLEREFAASLSATQAELHPDVRQRSA